MKLFVLLLLLCQQVYAKEPVSHQRYIAVIVKPDFRGEVSFAYRIKAACESLRWKIDIVDINNPKDLKRNRYDFVINLVPGSYKRPKCKNYLAIFHPLHHYFQPNGLLKKKYHCYDGYLLTYSPEIDDKNFNSQKSPYIEWYPTAQAQEYKKVDPARLFHLCCAWGNRFSDEKFREFLSFLDAEPYSRFYGSQLFQALYPQSYQCSIPYDNDSLYETARNAGVTLILHSYEHNAYGVPSGRIFEAAAASTVIISDENAFVRQHFGDSVLYINTDESAESIYNQVQHHMNWILSNKAAALEKAKKAHEIYKAHFLLEDQLLRLGKFHDQLSKNTFWTWIKKASRLFFSWIKKICTFFYIGGSTTLHSLVNPIPSIVLPNVDHQYSLINSVDFHPEENLFCATYTHNNKIFLYEIDENHHPHFFQSLNNPLARLSEPQHAVFSPNGEKIVVANWTNQTLTIYQRKKNGLFWEKPVAIIPSPDALQHCKPHGIAFSPCGNYLAVAYGASSNFERGVALFQSKQTGFECISLLKNIALPGTPKGITFSPDGTCLLVTFCEIDNLSIFNIENHAINSVPKQTVQGENTGISRPEDVKISPNGRYCAVTNSDRNTVTFYPFDQKSNSISSNAYCHVLQNPEAQLCFPHGIAFSPDGSYLAVTQFGPIQMTEQGDIFWDREMKSDEAKVNLYLMSETN